MDIESRIVYGFSVSFRYLWKLITKLELQRLYQAFFNEFSYYQLYLSFSFVLFILLVFWNGYKKWRWQYKLGIPLKWSFSFVYSKYNLNCSSSKVLWSQVIIFKTCSCGNYYESWIIKKGFVSITSSDFIMPCDNIWSLQKVEEFTRLIIFNSEMKWAVMFTRNIEIFLF